MEIEKIIAIAVFVIAVIFFLKRFGDHDVDFEPRELTDENIKTIALQGKKIEAIKMYRKLHGVELKQAKDAVEELIK